MLEEPFINLYFMLDVRMAFDGALDWQYPKISLESFWKSYTGWGCV